MNALEELVATELAESVDPRVAAMARALAANYPNAARAVLFYGSCLRTAELDGQMLDFYLIVSDYRAAYGKSWLAAANRLIPPNVFPFEHEGLAAKYAVLSEADFRRLTGPEASTVSVWARFAQPSRLVWAADDFAARGVAEAVAKAHVTLLALTPGSSDMLGRWREGFARTYAAELRAERGERPGSIVDHDPARYRRVSDAIGGGALGLPGCHDDHLERKWRKLRRNGKALTVVRLAKATFTFADGIDYLAWKINRHAGTDIAVKPWQRRHPLIGALTLLPRLLARGAVR